MNVLPYIWVIPLFPLAGFLLVGTLWTMGVLRGAWVHRLAVGASALAFVVSGLAVWDFAGGVGR